jgi:F-type H+-transporting ATPase subunit epsilon
MARQTNTVEVAILDLNRLLYAGSCLSVTAPAALGELCIRPRHAPLLSRLQTGEVRIRTADDRVAFYFVAGGFLEVSNNVVTILADHSLRSEEIDRQAALQARQQAEALLKTNPVFSERDSALIARAEALIKLRILEHARHASGFSVPNASRF